MLTTMRIALLVVLCAASAAFPQLVTSTFTYQGELSNTGTLANGSYDFRLRIYDDPIDGNQTNPEVCAVNVAVVDGRFTVRIGVPAGFNGNQAFLEIDVRPAVGDCGNLAGYITLNPRQALTATPYASYALFAGNASLLSGQPTSFFLNAGNLNSGTLPSMRFSGAYISAVSLTNNANTFLGTYTGNGAALSNLNASTLNFGTVPDLRLSANVARRDQTNTFTQNNTFSQSAFVSSQLGIGTSTPDTRLHVSSTADVSAGGGGVFTLGSFPSGAYLKADGNEIQTFTNGAVSNFAINASGGMVVIGAGTAVTQLTVNGGSDLDASGGGFVTVGTATTSLRLDTNEIQCFNGAAPAALLLNASGGLVSINSTTVITPLTIGGGTDIAGSGGGVLTVGNNSDSVRIDPNEIQAFANGNPGTLRLNDLGGNVEVGGTLIYSGNIGRGTGVPLAAIHLREPAANTVLRTVLHSNGSSQSRSHWAEDYLPGADVAGGYVNYDGATNLFHIGTTQDNFLFPAIQITRATLDVRFLGSISKAGGSFMIDHPTDPENKYLYHSFVESPDMKNIYDGLATTDGNGYAEVTLPAYFNALNTDFRYQLTVIDEGDEQDVILWAKVVRKIGRDAPNRFTVRTSRPNLEVSWQVTGVRQDAWARSNRIQTEVDKPAQERGKYLHPEAHGKPPTLGSSYREGTTAAERESTARQAGGAGGVARAAGESP